MRSEIGVGEVIEQRAPFDNLSKVNERCHKNVIMHSDSGVAESLCALFSSTFLAASVDQDK